MRINILGVGFDNVTMEEALARGEKLLCTPGAHYVVTPNPEIVETCRARGAISKVIFENCYLTQKEKIALCDIARSIRPDFVKTSTGFGTGGATREDVALFAKHVGPDVKIKAAGGIADLNDARDFIALGADRLGTSRIVKAVKAMEQ